MSSADTQRAENWLLLLVCVVTAVAMVQVKVSVLSYMQGLCQSMDPAELTNTSDTRLAMTRIVTWTTDPSSVDVRQVTHAHARTPLSPGQLSPSQLTNLSVTSQLIRNTQHHCTWPMLIFTYYSMFHYYVPLLNFDFIKNVPGGQMSACI